MKNYLNKRNLITLVVLGILFFCGPVHDQRTHHHRIYAE